MGRIVTQVTLTNFVDRARSISISALVDTGAAYITLPEAWRSRLGQMEQLAEIDLEFADQSSRRGHICGPVLARIGQFRPIVTEVVFWEMQPDEGGQYEPLIGYIALGQAGAAVDMLGNRLVSAGRADLK